MCSGNGFTLTLIVDVCVGCVFERFPLVFSSDSCVFVSKFGSQGPGTWKLEIRIRSESWENFVLSNNKHTQEVNVNLSFKFHNNVNVNVK